jgi:hypothetical protein
MRDNERPVECSVKGCTEVLPARLIRCHVAWHLLVGGVGDDGAGGGGGVAGGDAAPCGLCAERPQMQIYSEEASGGGRPVWVVKKRQVSKASLQLPVSGHG